MIRKFIDWILSFFRKPSVTADLDKKIAASKKSIKAIDKELEKDYTTVDEALKEFNKE
jgi:hypothetical protein